MCKYVIVLLRGSFHKCYSIVNLIFQFAQLFFFVRLCNQNHFTILYFYSNTSCAFNTLCSPWCLDVLPGALISLSLLEPHSQHGRVERKLKE